MCREATGIPEEGVWSSRKGATVCGFHIHVCGAQSPGLRNPEVSHSTSLSPVSSVK